MRSFRVLFFACLHHLGACSTALDLEDYPPMENASAQVLKGGDFLHKVVHKSGQGDVLHVYIEGDGRPWISPHSVARDPTPRRASLLDLMALDAAPALYLGRPCYFHTDDPACSDSRWWTSHRYAGEVVDSLGAVLDRFSTDYASVALIGYSGGGTLAYLLAADRDDVSTLVTLAGNLNVSLWTAESGYTSLSGSRNPAQEPPLGNGLRQLHVWGEGDTTVSREVVASVVRRQPKAAMVVLEGVDHSCCWLQEWPALLDQIE